MTWKEKIRKAWKNKKDICKGFYNRYLNFMDQKRIKEISEVRLAVCRLDLCGYYDKNGSSPNAVVKGSETCSGCGCRLKEKTSIPGATCYLAEINKTPLWESSTL